MIFSHLKFLCPFVFGQSPFETKESPESFGLDRLANQSDVLIDWVRSGE
jgi:hypothetical protein